MIKRILIVDDSAVGRKLVRRCAEFAGLTACEFLEAENGAVALDLIEKSSFQLMITDLNMPVMDGFELLRALDGIPSAKGMFKVVISSAASQSLKEPLSKHGVLAIVPKPISPQGFAKALSTILVQQRKADE
jgi:two-component system chemotaxis response regulator CheY